MTAQIRAVRPPVVALVCASEGGNQRAVMFSYEWKTQTLYRESVIRILERMRRIGRQTLGSSGVRTRVPSLIFDIAKPGVKIL